MKMQFAAIALILGSSSVLATDLTFVNADGSALSGLCIAAAQSDKTVRALASDMNIETSGAEVRCNGKPIRNFVAQFRAEVAADATPEAVFVSVANAAPETQLCVAALVSKEEFTRLKEIHFNDVAVEREITCNGLPLNQFVRRYQDRVAALPGAATASI